MKLSGSDIVIECLKEQNVDTIFGFPGGAVLNIYDSLYRRGEGINHILTTHEQERLTQRTATQEQRVKQEYAWLPPAPGLQILLRE